MTDNELGDRLVDGGPAELAITRSVGAPRKRVWRAWTDPERVAEWWGPDGFTNTIQEMDGRPGGVWRFTMHDPDGDVHRNAFPYVEVVEPERLVYTHPDEGGRPEFRVTVTFEEGAGGDTDLAFRMVFDSASDREMLEEFGGVEAANQTLDSLEGFLANDGAGGAK